MIFWSGKKTRLSFKLGWSFLFIILISNCAQPKEPKDPFALTTASIGEPRRLIPMLASDSASQTITSLIFNGLVKYDKNIQLVGDLAESFERAPDCRSATFHLRKGVKWQDGREFTADDVLFTYQKIIDPNVITPYSSAFETVEKVEKVDPYTVRVVYREPFAPGLESWTMGILPKHLLEGENLNTDPFSRNPVGTGPFRFSEWVTGQRVTLNANPDYFEGKPAIEAYIYRLIPDTATQFLELRALNIDLMGLSPIQYQKQTDSPFFKKEFNKFKYPALSYTYIGYNLRDPRFSDQRVRQALTRAINKKAIIQGVLLGLGRPATGPYIPESWAFNPDVRDLDYNPEEAKALLAEAGWRPDSDGLLKKEGRSFAFTLLTNQGNAERAKAAEIIQRDLSKIGIQVQIRTLEWQTLLHQFIDKRQFEAVIMGWGVGLDPDIYNIWHSGKIKEGEFNFISYQNPQVDDLLIKGRQTCNQEERKKIYRQVHRLIAEDQPYTFLYYPMALPVVQKRFQGIAPSPIGITYNLPKWTISANRME